MSKKITDSRFFTLNNGLGLIGTFSTTGASVYSLSLDGTPLILTPSDKVTFLNSDQFFGKTLGRVAGRIPDRLELDHFSYDLTENEPGVCLHGGGPDSLSFVDFDCTIVTRPDRTYVIFSYVSPDGEAGFPANVRIKVTYSFVHDENSLRIKYEAQSDSTTILSLSNHMYFNFDTDNVDDYTLQVRASRVGVKDETTRLISGYEDVPDQLDFRRPSSLKDKLYQASDDEWRVLDDTYLFDDDDDVSKVILENSKFRVECSTTYEACNIYLEDTRSDISFINSVGRERRGIAIEPQMSPLSPFVLKPGIRYRQVVLYHFYKR